MSDAFVKGLALAGATVIAAALVLVAARGPVLAAQENGAQSLYLDKCAVCHGADGAGKTAKGRKLKVKDVRETIRTESKADMITIVTNGKAPDMDAYGKTFTAAQIEALVDYYRGLAAQK